MQRRLILDSGAYSVWAQGQTVDLDEYIDFCAAYPAIDYYVALDVIPGQPNVKRSLRNAEESCQASWLNYKEMIAYLPMEKVIPVFHQHDSFRWLERYIKSGAQYIGISPANDRTTTQKLAWLRQVRPHVFFPSGEARVKTHGFAVTSFDLMRYWDWYSVDSASWKVAAGWGVIYVPRQTRGKWDYSRSPYALTVSPRTTHKKQRQTSYEALSPHVKEIVDRYLAESEMPLGKWAVGKRSGDRVDGREILWFDRKKDTVIRVEEEGVATMHVHRYIANVRFMQQAEKVLPLKHLYLAGAPLPPVHREVELRFGKRLLSYLVVGTGKRPPLAFRDHYHERELVCEQSKP